MLTLDPLARAPRPTLAFKDLGMCLLVEVLDYFLAQDQRRLCLVVWVSKQQQRRHGWFRRRIYVSWNKIIFCF
jgi:hypothetical protein